MFDKDRWQEILYALKENKLRTFMTAFGIFWGILMLMIMLGAGTGLQNGIKRNFGEHALNSCFIYTRPTTLPYKGFKKGREYNFELKDIELLKRQIPEIALIAPRYYQGNSTVSRNKKSEGFTILGDYPEYNRIDPSNILQGRYINQKDIDERRKVIDIGQRVKEVLYEPSENPIGTYLKINGVYFEVIGVMSSKKSGGQSAEENKWITMPLTTMQKSFNLGGILGWFMLTTKPNVPVKYIEDKSISVLKAAHYVNPDDNDAVGHGNIEEMSKNINGLFLGIQILIWIVGLGTLFAGVVGVSNIMLVVVRERTQEIGIQRAIGATPWNIITQLVMESVMLVSMAGYLGLFAGIGLVELINSAISGQVIEAFSNPQISLKVAFSALIIMIICGLLAAIIPARKAVSMKPIDAIRSEYK